ncbi:HlyD family secretion protein [Flavisphingomonas formosensis]|uniref:HlyD family secretion protein n=1 Tax=Flavisphingomonas formosensis TaxID=861534 RepID=UPI0012F7EFCA|nr:efflux RND transporter periplasmic adaptor subunit [Sphingomonas formosensis]
MTSLTDLREDGRPESADEESAPPSQAAPTQSPPAAQAAPEKRGNASARRRWFLVLGVFVLLGLIGYGVYALLFAGRFESTDDAYVAGDVVAITSREPATVIALHADNTEAVRRGQPLIDFDPATADATMAAAEAQLAQAVRSVRSNFSKVDESRAEVIQAQADLSRASNDLARRKSAAADGAVSGEEVSHAADAVRTAQAALDLARSRVAQSLSSVQGTNVETNPDVLAAIANFRRAAIVQAHMRLTAPVDGVIAQRTVQLGQQVAAGVPLMAVVPLRSLWIDANFRETQLKHIRVGQPVEIEADVYGGEVTYHGHVIGLGAGSGNAFALLPPQNASGNWIKVVQRVPVRIALDPAELDRNPLRIGLSVTAKVDVRDHSGPLVARIAAGTFQKQASQDGGPDVEAQIARIIAANRGTTR